MSSYPNAWLANRIGERKALTDRIASTGQVSLEGIRSPERMTAFLNEIDFYVHLAYIRRNEKRVKSVRAAGPSYFKRMAAISLKTKASRRRISSPWVILPRQARDSRSWRRLTIPSIGSPTFCCLGV